MKVRGSELLYLQPDLFLLALRKRRRVHTRQRCPFDRDNEGRMLGIDQLQVADKERFRIEHGRGKGLGGPAADGSGEPETHGRSSPLLRLIDDLQVGGAEAVNRGVAPRLAEFHPACFLSPNPDLEIALSGKDLLDPQ